jgi:hypothetical protein
MMRLLKQKNTKLITGEEIHLNLYLQQEKNLDPQKRKLKEVHVLKLK